MWLAVAAVMLMYAQPAFAVPVFGVQVQVVIDENSDPTLPGNVTTVFVWGDESYRLMQDQNGNAVIRDDGTQNLLQKGKLCWAQRLASGVLQSTGTLFDPNNLAAVPAITVTTAKNLNLDLASVFASFPVPTIPNIDVQIRKVPSAQVSGPHRGLCILVQFPEKSAAPLTTANVDNFCNYDSSKQASRYSEFSNNGSVYDFFYEVSNQKLQFTNTVPTSIFTTATARSTYDTSSQKYGAPKLIMDALKGIGSVIDMTGVEVDANGTIKYLSVMYAGDMPADNGYPLWPHRWAVKGSGSGLDNSFVAKDGKTYFADNYQLTNLGTQLSIGTFCHECGHMVCGFSDYYDTSYNSQGLGNWDLMAGGSWNNNAKNPAPPQPYLRYRAGWLAPRDATSNVTSVACNFTDAVKFANPNAASEYFIIAGIRKTGGAASLHYADMPGEGLAIFHIDEAVSGNKAGSGTHYEAALIQADGKGELEKKEGSGGNRGNAGDLFAAPSTTSFSGSTTPAATWWDASVSTLSISSIGSSGGDTITLQFGSGGGGTPPQIVSGPSADPASPQAGDTVTFSVSVTDSGTPSINWDFGDSTTGSGATVTHTYTAPAAYNVTCTVAGSGGTTTAQMTLTVVDASKPVTINKGKFQLNFKTKKDSMDVTFYDSSFVYGDKNSFWTATNSSRLLFYIGDTLMDSVQTYRGKGKNLGTVTWNYKFGQIRYVAKNAQLQDVLKTYGATDNNTSGSVTVPLDIEVSGVRFGGQYTFAYSAVPAKVGKGQVSR
jgi:M6 family metalloprotease-like protein